MAEQVRKGLARDGDAELGGVREVRLHGLTWAMKLGEEHLLGRPRSRPPLTYPPLKASKLARLVSTRHLRDQKLKDGLGFQARSLLESGFDPGPILFEGVLPSPPCPWLLQGRRKLPGIQVLTCRLAVHPGHIGCQTDPATLGHLIHELPHLAIGRHQPPYEWKEDAPDRLPMDGAV